MKILYVDDDRDIRDVAEMALGLDPGLEIRLAASGQEALVVAAQWQPDAILLDVMMPGLDGPSTLRGLRQQAETMMIPVIFITARAHPGELAGLASIGARGVIAKPFDPMVLAQEVRAILHEGDEPL